jgi:hypothetical protein
MNLAEPSDDLRSFAARVASAHGAALFPSLAEFLAHLLDASEVQIGEPLDPLQARTLGVFARGAIQPNYTFAVVGTACEALLADSHREEGTAPEGAGSNGTGESDEPHVPEPGADNPGCFGTALRDGHGHIAGFLCAYFTGSPDITERQHHVVEIAAARLAAELSLQRTERARAELESQVLHLRARLDSLERSEVASAATGTHVPPAVAAAAIDLEDTAATGLHHVQREHILRVLNATRWVIEGNSGAALKLGMKPATLRHRMKKLGIARVKAPSQPTA